MSQQNKRTRAKRGENNSDESDLDSTTVANVNKDDKSSRKVAKKQKLKDTPKKQNKGKQTSKTSRKQGNETSVRTVSMADLSSNDNTET